MVKETEKNKEKTAGSSQEKQPGSQPKVKWDSSTMRSAYANVFNVSGAREEFVMLFGMNQAWDAGQQELKVQLTDRIVMSPSAAKRFATLMNNVLEDYEKRYGVIKVEASQTL
jgi:hypothetical protein